jgi:serine/threonine-protein kinase
MHVVRIFDTGVTEDRLPYIVMEYLEGESLSDALIRRGPLPAVEIAKIVAQASRALRLAHAENIVHRDLKPDNIFLASNVAAEDLEGLPYIVKLVDFGIAKMLDTGAGGKGIEGPTQVGAVIGTPNFMSPEQLSIGGPPDALSDVWALGACVYAAFTARIPFEGDVIGDIAVKVCVSPLPVPSAANPLVPPGLDAWFERACNRDPSARFQSVDQLSRALSEVCGYRDDFDVRTVPKARRPSDESTGPTKRKATKLRRALFFAGFIGGFVLVALALMFVWRLRTHHAEGPAPTPTVLPPR